MQTSAKLNRFFAQTGLVLMLGAGAGCSDGKSADAAPACEEECRDRVALRALRETLKLVYNLTLQGGPVGEQNASTSCPLGGRARVTGFATSNPDQGASELDLVYTLERCAYLKRSATPAENYVMGFEGSVRESGTLAVQPSATTALIFSSDSLSLAGTIYDPPQDFLAESCSLQVAQSGRNLSGLLCDRPAGLDL